MNENITVDVIVPSLSKPEHHKMIKNCINSLRDSEKNIKFNVVLIESWKEHFDLGQDKTIKFDLEKFNYNHALNQGISATNNEWIVLANNDLIFQPNWMKEILLSKERNPDVVSFCPYEPTHHKDKDEKYGYFKDCSDICIGYKILVHLVEIGRAHV